MILSQINERYLSGEDILKFIRTNYGYIEKDITGIFAKYKNGDTKTEISEVILKNLISEKSIRKILETKTATIYKLNKNDNGK